ncbi:MAG: preprotein translocase subunit SecY [Bacillota bacterium]
MGNMLETLRNAFKIADLRKKLIFTIFMLLVFRFGSHIPVPGVDEKVFQEAFGKLGALGGLMDIISGGSLKAATIFAMSITPYINSSIIMQLLTVAIPRLERLQKEGEEGRKKIQQYVRYGTVVLGFFQASVMFISLSNMNSLKDKSFFSYLTIALALTAGTAFLMWLGEQITEKGVGNGISLLIFAGIVSRAPQGGVTLYENFATQGVYGVVMLVIILAVFLGVIAAVIWVNQAERRLPVQYAKRVVGRKMYGGQSTHIPIKVNLAGVIPIIFAMSIMMFPSTIVSLFGGDKNSGWVSFFSNPDKGLGAIGYSLVYSILIIFFTFFYSIIQFNPIEIANNLKKNGGIIPSVRPGKPTSDYISKVLGRITWFGGFFLAAVTVFPIIIGNLTGFQGIWFGGTAVLILVGVALETVKQIESMMLMRHYKGFLE